MFSNATITVTAYAKKSNLRHCLHLWFFYSTFKMILIWSLLYGKIVSLSHLQKYEPDAYLFHVPLFRKSYANDYTIRYMWVTLYSLVACD